MQQINVVIDKVLVKHAKTALSPGDSKTIVEEVFVSLKDEDDKWIEYDHAPRNHSNPIFSHTYQRTYRMIQKRGPAKFTKPAIKTTKSEAAKDAPVTTRTETTGMSQKSVKTESVFEDNKSVTPSFHIPTPPTSVIMPPNRRGEEDELTYAEEMVKEYKKGRGPHDSDDPFWKNIATIKRDIKRLEKELKRKRDILSVYFEDVCGRFRIDSDSGSEK